MPELKKTIQEDCVYYENLVNKGLMYCNYLRLQDCENSESNGLYQLILNGSELWYGTLQEINAVVKSMIRLKENKGGAYSIM